MTPAATAAHCLRRRLESGFCAINRTSPAAAKSRSRRVLDTAASPARPFLAAQQQQQRCYAYAYAFPAYGRDSLLDEVLGADFQPEADELPTIIDVPRERRQYRTGNAPLPSGAAESASDSAEAIQYVARLPAALRSRDVDSVLQCMIAGAHDAAFIRSIPSTTFTEIIRLVTSDRELQQLRRALDHTWWVRAPAWQTENAAIAKLMRGVRIMIALRRDAGMPLSMGDYKLLLMCAANVADKTVASDLWHDMSLDGYVPDTACHNALMHAILWHRRLDPSSGGWKKAISWRVDRYYIRARQRRRIPYAPDMGGYEARIKAIFDNLLQNGLLGDESTIISLITAFAREGNLPAMKDTLKRVWNIDVDEVMARGQQRSPPTAHHASSALRPTPRLLFAVAHGFGANSEIPTALRLIDFISRSYRLPITTGVWAELFTWTAVQAQPRRGRFQRMHRVDNPLPLAAPEQLWQTLTQPPYCARPDMRMLHLSVQNLTAAQRHDVAARRIRSGFALYEKHVREARSAVSQFEKAQKGGAARRRGENGRQQHHQQRPLSELRRARDAAVIAVKRDRELLRRWCQMYLGRGNGFGFEREVTLADGQVALQRETMYDTLPEWAYKDVPDFVRRFREFCPSVVRYRTHAGVVELELRARPMVEEGLEEEERSAREMQRERWFEKAKVMKMLEAVKSRGVRGRVGGGRKVLVRRGKMRATKSQSVEKEVVSIDS